MRSAFFAARTCCFASRVAAFEAGAEPGVVTLGFASGEADDCAHASATKDTAAIRHTRSRTRGAILFLHQTAEYRNTGGRLTMQDYGSLSVQPALWLNAFVLSPDAER